MKISLEQLAQSENRFYGWKGRPEVAPPPDPIVQTMIDVETVMPDFAPVSAATILPAPTLAPPLSFLIPTSHSDEAEKMLPISENLDKRKQMLEESALEPVDFAFERAIGRNDSVYSNFVELISYAKQKVGRIVVKDGIQTENFATGFMVSNRLLLTNWHVFNSREDVRDSEVEFFYELDTFGRPRQPTSFRLAPEEFFHANRGLDYCLLAVQPFDISGKVPLSSIGWHFLNPTTGKIADEGMELLNIIHHPDGDFKQLSIRENRFVKILPNFIWYESDTAPGSSGSPVFNDQWQVVALHHMGVASRNAEGQFLDKKGNIIVPVDGKLDMTRIHWLANEGVRISVLLKDIFAQFPKDSLVAGLREKPGQPSRPEPSLIPLGKSVEASPFSKENQPNMENNTSGDVRISFPASLLENSGNISIQINKQTSTMPSTVPQPAQPSEPNGQPFLPLGDELEAKRVELENTISFFDAEGYRPDFLGQNIPMPMPKKALLKFAALQKHNKETVLNYHRYSVIQHAIRKMPIISAINVDGDPAKQLDKSPRGEVVWLRDRRIDFEAQLNEQFYRNSGFDKGHLSRREDANWGDTPEEAKKFADLTCMHTNACPQVPKLNQSNRGGLWGKLEVLALEKGVRQQSGQFSKISVFNGPVFSEEDRIFKGIQIPMDFWKVIVWPGEQGELKATAFLLTQTGLTEGINFEALDIDKNLEFQPIQVSIKQLEKLTKIDFSGLAKFDTFKPRASGAVSLQLNSQQEVSAILKG